MRKTTFWTWPKLFLGFILLAVVGLGGVWYWHSTKSPRSYFVTATTQRGELVATVSATGTIEPEESIDIGAQVVGMITKFGADPNESDRSVDWGSRVEEGSILAYIDDSIYSARVEKGGAMVKQAEASITQAEADIARADANVIQYQAQANKADRDWKRAQNLRQNGSLSAEDFDAQKSAFEVANANITVGGAAAKQARAAKEVAEKNLIAARADLKEQQKNLDYTVIRSPVKGVIIDRRVNVGQTVVSSLNAPSLFLIAKNLKRLEIWTSVNEADIGRIAVGQPASFTVDAFPNETFQGVVKQKRLNATMTQNVVTYTVVVGFENPDERLLPYLTANVKFEIARRADALTVPNAALRWQPLPGQIAAGSTMPRERKGDPGKGVVWIDEGGFVRPVVVKIGVTDGLNTEILGGELNDSDAIVVGERAMSGSDATTNPFAPTFLKGKKN